MNRKWMDYSERAPLDELDLNYEPFLNVLEDKSVNEEDEFTEIINTLSKFVDNALKGKELYDLAMNKNIFTGDTWALESYNLFQKINQETVSLEFNELVASLKTVLALHSGESVAIPENGLEHTIAFVQGLQTRTVLRESIV